MRATIDDLSGAVALAARLEDLPVQVDSVRVESVSVPVATYPGGQRASAHLILKGGRHHGRGEHVAFAGIDHSVLAGVVRQFDLPTEGTVYSVSSKLSGNLNTNFERAAFECALLDLALRQADCSFFAFAEHPPRPVRYVASCDARTDLDAVRRLRADAGESLELKLDIFPDVDGDRLAQIADLGPITILDFKGHGGVRALRKAVSVLPSVWLEDPGTLHADQIRVLSDLEPEERRHVTFDSPILTARDIPTAVGMQPVAINLKIPRMGGVLAVLRAIAVCEASGIETYMGGMFEVGVGRDQARALAALFSPDGPNDLASLAAHGRNSVWPLRLTVADLGPGFATEPR